MCQSVLYHEINIDNHIILYLYCIVFDWSVHVLYCIALLAIQYHKFKYRIYGWRVLQYSRELSSVQYNILQWKAMESKTIDGKVIQHTVYSTCTVAIFYFQR